MSPIVDRGSRDKNGRKSLPAGGHLQIATSDSSVLLAKRLVPFALFLVFSLQSSAPQATDVPPNIVRATLSNGLHVVILRNPLGPGRYR